MPADVCQTRLDVEQPPTVITAQQFTTAWGIGGLAWSSRGVCALELPGPDAEEGWRRLAQRVPGELVRNPPAEQAALVARIQRHLQGEPDSFADVRLDLTACRPLARQVYAQLRRVPPGKTTTYADLALLADRAGAARAVGRLMADNAIPLLIPCHRVLAADGALGGFSAPGGPSTKLRLLTVEGADLQPIARAGCRQLARADSRLAPIIRRVGPYQVRLRQEIGAFAALCESIVHQQVSMKAGAAIFGRLQAAVAGADGQLTPARLLGAPADQLRAAGLSRQKVGYLQDLAQRSSSGQLQLDPLGRLDDAQVIAQLTQVKGIGRWSAEMFLIFRLGRLDVLPVADLGLQKGAQLLFGLPRLPGAAQLEELARPWRPFRSLATWYLWRAQDAGGL